MLPATLARGPASGGAEPGENAEVAAACRRRVTTLAEGAGGGTKKREDNKSRQGRSSSWWSAVVTGARFVTGKRNPVRQKSVMTGASSSGARGSRDINTNGKRSRNAADCAENAALSGGRESSSADSVGAFFGGDGSSAVDSNRSGVDSNTSGRDARRGDSSSPGSGGSSCCSSGSSRSSSSHARSGTRGAWSRTPTQEHSQKPRDTLASFLVRLLRRGTVRREHDAESSSKDGRDIRPPFERRRKRYRTVSWKYKKSIGFVASFVFLCNQILAPGLTSMPLTLIEYGWLPSLLTNVLFCLLSSLCSLLLLRSVTLIEDNHNFDERFEYSATLRHFLAPVIAEQSAGAGRAGARATGAAAATQSAALLAASTGQAAAPPRKDATTAPAGGVRGALLRKTLLYFCGLRHPFSERSTQQFPPAGQTGEEPAATGDTGVHPQEEGRKQGPATVMQLYRLLSATATTASDALSGFGGFCSDRGESKDETLAVGEGTRAGDEVKIISSSVSSSQSGSSRILHCSSSETPTRTAYSENVKNNSSAERDDVISPASFCVQADGGIFLRKALYGLQRLSGRQQERQQTASPLPQRDEEGQNFQSSSGVGDSASAEQSVVLLQLSGSVQRAAAAAAGAGITVVTNSGGTAAAARSSDEAAAPSEAALEESRGTVDQEWVVPALSMTPSASASAVATSGCVKSVAKAASHLNGNSAQPAAVRQLFHVRLKSVLLWVQHRVRALLPSPFYGIAWLCSLPHQVLQRTYAAVVRPPPLLPSSFPRLLSWLLHLNTFLSTCSAALLVAYCIDCLLLRIFSCTLFIPLLPTHVSSTPAAEPGFLAAAGHWAGALVSLLLHPFCVVGNHAVSLFYFLGTAGASVVATMSAVTAAATKSDFAATLGSTSVAATVAEFVELARQHGSALLEQVHYQFLPLGVGFSECIRQLPERLPRRLLASLSAWAAAVAEGFSQEHDISAAYGAPGFSFIYVLPSQHQIEEVFSGMCSSGSSCSLHGRNVGAAQISPAMKPSLFAGFFAPSSTAGGSAAANASLYGAVGAAVSSRSTTAAAAGWGSFLGHSAAAATADQSLKSCVPQCVSHMGITMGYLITAAICLHLAAADLQENARMQLLSFGAIIAAVLQVSCSAALMLLHSTSAPAAVPATSAAAAAAATLPAAFTAAAKGEAVVSAAASSAAAALLPAEKAAAGTSSLAGAPSRAAWEQPKAALTRQLAAAGSLSAVDGSTFAKPAGVGTFYSPFVPFVRVPWTTTAGRSILADSHRDVCSRSGDVRAAAEKPAYPQAAAGKASSSSTSKGPESSWPNMIVRGSGMGALVSTFVDAYSYSNALPSWANEIKDNVPVTKTVFLSTSFACSIYFLFGLLCAAAFPVFSTSSNVLAAMLPTCHSLVAAGCICFFHIFALLPNIVISQISRRYDLLNMAICLDKPSAFYVASTMPWMLYWLLTFSPVFATPSQLLTLLSNVLLNFAAPALVYIYALHATASSKNKLAGVAETLQYGKSVEGDGARGGAAAIEWTAAAEAAAAVGPAAAVASNLLRPARYATDGAGYRDLMVLRVQQGQQQQQEQGDAAGEATTTTHLSQETALEAEAGLAILVGSEAGDTTTTRQAICLDTFAFTPPTYVPSISYEAEDSLSPVAQIHNQLSSPSVQQLFSRVDSKRDVEAAGRGNPRFTALCRAAQLQKRSSLSLAPVARRFTMQAVPEEECEGEEDGQATAADNRKTIPFLPSSLMHLRQSSSQDSTTECNSGSMSRWSTNCFGEDRTAARGDGGGREDAYKLQSSASYKRAQSQNVLCYHSQMVGKRAPAEDRLEADLLAKRPGDPVLQRGSTNCMLGDRKNEQRKSCGGGALAPFLAAKCKSSSKGEEKLGKMRVAGAVAGGGGARSREVQRQLQTWLEEYSRQMPESEVAQLLQRQQREEQQEEMRMQLQEFKVKQDLRRKIENQWRREQVFRFEDDASPSLSYGGGSPSRSIGNHESALEQIRSCSVPPSGKTGDAGSERQNGGEGGVSADVAQPPQAKVAVYPKLSRRCSRTLSYGRFLRPPQATLTSETNAEASAAPTGDVAAAGNEVFNNAAEVAAGEEVEDKEKQVAGVTANAYKKLTPAGGREETHALFHATAEVCGGETETGALAKARSVLTSVVVDDERCEEERLQQNPLCSPVSDGEAEESKHREDERPITNEAHKPPGERVEDDDLKTSGRQEAAGSNEINRIYHPCSSSSTETQAGRHKSWSSNYTSASQRSSRERVTATVPDAAAAANGGIAPVLWCTRSGGDGKGATIAFSVVEDGVPQPPQQKLRLGKLEAEEAGANAVARRTAKKSARIDSVSVAMHQRRRQQLLKKQKQLMEEPCTQQQQQLTEVPRKWKFQRNNGRRQQQQTSLEQQQCAEQVEKQHRNEDGRLFAYHARSRFQRTSVRHATRVVEGARSGTRGQRNVEQSVAEQPAAAAPSAAGVSAANCAYVAGTTKKGDPPVDDVQTFAGMDAAVISSGTYTGYSSENERRVGSKNAGGASSEGNSSSSSIKTSGEPSCESSTAEKNKYQVKRFNEITCEKKELCDSFTATAGHAAECRNEHASSDRSIRGAIGVPAQPFENRVETKEKEDPPQQGIEREVLRREVLLQETLAGPQVVKECRELGTPREESAVPACTSGVRRRTLQKGTSRRGSRTGVSNRRSTCERKSETECSIKTTSTPDAYETTKQEERMEDGDKESRSAFLRDTRSDAAAEKATRCSPAAICTSSTGYPASIATVKRSLSKFCWNWGNVSVFLAMVRSNISTVFLCRGCGFRGMCSFLSFRRYVGHSAAHLAAHDVSLSLQQRQGRQQCTGEPHERVALFPWLRSTEEQLVATYALLVVVLYSATAALADGLWRPLEPVHEYIWRHICALMSSLWAVRWRILLFPTLPVAELFGDVLRSGSDEAERYEGSTQIDGVLSWLLTNVRKVQLLATGLADGGSSRESLEVDAEVKKILAVCSRQGCLGTALPPGAETKVPAKALPTLRTEDGVRNVEESVGLSVEIFFTCLLALVAFALPLLRYASIKSEGHTVVASRGGSSGRYVHK